jgi:hypothetical protein
MFLFLSRHKTERRCLLSTISRNGKRRKFYFIFTDFFCFCSLWGPEVKNERGMEGGVKVIEPFYLRLQCTINFYHLFTPISMSFFSLWPGPNIIKPFTPSIYEFVPGKPFPPSLMFASKALEPTRVKHFSGTPLQGRLMTLPTSIRLAKRKHFTL